MAERGAVAQNVNIYPVLAAPTMVPVLLEGRLTVDGPAERGPLVVWVRRG